MNPIKYLLSRYDAWKLRKLKPFQKGDQVLVKFDDEDTFSPDDWEAGMLVSDPWTDRDTKTYVSIKLDDGLYLAAHRIDNVRLK